MLHIVSRDRKSIQKDNDLEETGKENQDGFGMQYRFQHMAR